MYLDHLFISVQTLNSQALCDSLPTDYYDYIVVDEFHHAAAPTHQKLLNHFQPKLLRRDRNTSLILPAVIQKIAELKGISPEEVEWATSENTIRLFRLPVLEDNP